MMSADGLIKLDNVAEGQFQINMLCNLNGVSATTCEEFEVECKMFPVKKRVYELIGMIRVFKEVG